MSVVPLREEPHDRVHELWLQHTAGKALSRDAIVFLFGVIADQRASLSLLHDAEWQEAYRAYLTSDGWRVRREAALHEAGYRCELCGHRRRLQVHHRDYTHVFHETPDDLIVLCPQCHRKQHS